MKKLLLLFLALSPLLSTAQVVVRTDKKIQRDNKLDIKDLLTLPKVDSTAGITGLQGAPIRWDNSSKLIKVYDGSVWQNVGEIKPGANISSFVNNAGYISGGTDTNQVRNNSQLDARYLQTELDPTVEAHIKGITTGDISNWNSKLSSITGSSGINVNATDPSNPIISLGIDTNKYVTLAGAQHITGTKTVDTLKFNPSGALIRKPPGGANNDNLQIYLPSNSGSLVFTPGTAGQSGINQYGFYTQGGIKIGGSPYYITSIGDGLEVTSAGVLRNTAGGGGGGGTATNLSIGTRTETTVAINSSSGTSAIFPAANSTQAGGMSAADWVKLNSISSGTLLGRYSSGTGAAQTITIGSGLSYSGGVLSATGSSASVFTRSVDGLVPAPGGSGTTRYLREDGTWGTPSGGGGGGISTLTGDVSATGSGTVTATITSGAVTNAKMANMAANTIKGRIGATGAPQDLSEFQLRGIINKTYHLTGVSIDVANGNKMYAELTASRNYAFTNFPAGYELQIEITNTGSSAINITFDGATFPQDIDGSIPAGKAAVFSMTKFGILSPIRVTKLIY